MPGALATGFGHARLPIDTYFKIATRKVLTVCHVFEIISNFCSSGNWETAIEKTIPERKGLQALDSAKQDSGGENDD